jgi:CO dehydrogenase/acetyl-CoA synthase alpha subunit
VVSELAQNDFDVIAFVEKVKEAVETLDRISEALREYRGARIKIVADKLDDEDKAAKLFLRVSQVVRIWEAKKAYGEAKAAADYFEKTLRPSLVLANACRRSKVDRIILASGDAPEKPGRLKISQEVLNVVRGGGALSEEAIRQSGVPCVKANLPAAKQAGSGLEGVAAAVGMLSHIISHKAIVGAEVSVPKQALSKAKGAQAMPRAFVLRSFAKANAGKA